MDYTNLSNQIQKAAYAEQLMPMSETLRGRLEYQLKNAKSKVSQLEELVVLLDSNPEFERMLTLLQGM